MLLAAFVLCLAACGQDGFDRAAAVDSFSTANPDATDIQSGCVIDRLIDRFGLDGLEEQLSADPQELDFEEAQFRDMFACGMEGDVQDQIAEQLENNGVAPADAPCVADELVTDLTDDDIDVLLSGDISDEFLAKFVAAMESCGAINS
jgi:hypothetical protein